MRHPRESRLDRREFLFRTGGAGVAFAGLGPLLAACGGGGGGPTGEGGIPLARPDAPVTLPLFDDNLPIESGLEPEKGPLRIYTWADYIWKRKLKEFGTEYGVDVELTTFTTMDEAIAKLSTGAVAFDVFFPQLDRLGRMAVGKVMQPLNKDYLRNLAPNVWPALQDPFYDQGSLYTVPYTIFTTGIGFRRDKVEPEPGELANPYEIFWDTAYRGKTYLLDDGREALAMALLRSGITDLNTEDPATIETAKTELLGLIDRVDLKIAYDDYVKIPEGTSWVHQAWSGDMVLAQSYLPEGTTADVLGYWYPPEGGGAIANDTMVVLRGAKNTVLAHHFLNFMLDEKHGYENFVQWTGYQPPFVSIQPDRLVSDGVIPANLRAAVVRESDFEKGNPLLELSPAGAALWQNAWAEIKSGG